jgi:putative membrane protein
VLLAVAMSAIHVLALGVGLPSIWARARALRRGDAAAALVADNWWGLAAVLWLASGLTRLLVTEKGLDWYLQQPAFWVKAALFAAVLALELWPMVVLLRWRIGGAPDLSRATALARISEVEGVLTLALPVAAAAMARGMRW